MGERSGIDSRAKSVPMLERDRPLLHIGATRPVACHASSRLDLVLFSNSMYVIRLQKSTSFGVTDAVSQNSSLALPRLPLPRSPRFSLR